MKILEKKFVYIEEWGDWQDSSNDGFSLCNDGLMKYFYIPDSCKEIWISIHTTPSSGREDFRVFTNTYCEWADYINTYKNKTFPYLVPEEEVKSFKGEKRYEFFNTTIQDNSLDEILNEYIDKVVYIQVEYEE